MSSAKVDGQDGSHPQRFVCPADGCTKSFQRKEHLTRHAKSHTDTAFVCSVCSRKFNRSDSLARHLVRHGESFKAPSSRSKAACIACHGAKIKCDGDKHCHNCVKKGIECKYRSNDNDAMPQLDEGVGLLEVSDSGVSMNDSSSEANDTPPSDSNSSNPSPATFPNSRSEAYINWSSIRIQRDDEPVKEPYRTPNVDHYFNHIHHRFPIIHRPSYIGETKGRTLLLLKCTMEMMGAWLEGSSQSREFALSLHQKLMGECLNEISNISSLDVYQQSLTAALCESVLLNVIFTLYCGKTSLVSRGLILHNMLITALREVGFFNPHTIWADEKPGVFLPYHMLKMGERQMLAETLFKIDVYLSFARGHAPIISPEELIFQVPSSFSLWNSNGLDAWEERLGKQPIFRMERTMYEMIDSTTEYTDMGKSNMLWEDIQLCLSSMQSKLWRLHTISRNAQAVESLVDPTKACKDVLKRQLGHLKIQIDQMFLCAGLPPHYYGFEDHNSPDSKPIIEARSETLRFDTIFLYHLLSIHLYCDISGLAHVVKEFSLDLAKYTEHQQTSIGDRRCAKASMLATPDFRRSLCHAVDILSEFQLLVTRPDAQKIGIDPIAYVALSTAALIVWTHVSFGLYSCDTCEAGMGFTLPETTLELGPSGQPPCLKEEWVEKGTFMKVQIDGLQICNHHLVPILGKFKAFLPADGWELSESIAPGVFSCHGALKTDHVSV